MIDIYIRGETDDAIRGIINKIASRKLAVTAAATGAVEITLPVAIVAAARQGQDDVVELLLERGADPSGGEAWARPLAWAERRKHGKIARRLKRAGAR